MAFLDSVQKFVMGDPSQEVGGMAKPGQMGLLQSIGYGLSSMHDPNFQARYDQKLEFAEERRREDAKRSALKQIAEQYTAGQIDQPTALMQYAAQTGDVGGLLGTNSPAALKEWNAYSQMTPEQQRQYITMKRANPYQDVGDALVQPDPLNPGTSLGGFKKNLGPTETPSYKKEAASATESGKQAALEDAAEVEAQGNTAGLLNVFDELESAAEAAPSGYLSNLATSAANQGLGIETDAGIEQGDFAVSVANAENAVRAAFRVAGSGAMTDRDAQPLIDMLPKANDPEGVKLKKISRVKELLVSKANAVAEAKGKPLPFPESAAPAQTGSAKRLVFNPATGRLE